MNSKGKNFYDRWGRAQKIVQHALATRQDKIRILKAIEVEEGNIMFEKPLKETYRIFREFQEMIRECRALLEGILDESGMLINRAKEGKIEEGTVGDVESRLKYIRGLYESCRKVEEFFEHMREGELESIDLSRLLKPGFFHALKDLFETSKGSIIVLPINVSGTIPFSYTI